MNRFNKIAIAILASMVVLGCTSAPVCPFNRSGENCDQITVTAYLPPVVVDLDYKNIHGSRDQVIVQGGYQHALSVSSFGFDFDSGSDPVSSQEPPQQTPQTFGLPAISVVSAIPDNAIPETETIGFEFDRSSIPGDQIAKLDALIQKIGKVGLMHIRVEGHTDSKGSAKYNKALSVKRAKSVKDYLMQHGIDPSKIAIKGFGESWPIAANDSDAHRAKNRRANLTPLTEK